MMWNIFSFETMFKRIFRYLIRRYFGQYLEDFSQNDLTYGLGHGKGSVENVRLNVDALNDLSQEYNLPVEFLHGSIEFVSIMVPWSSLLADNTVIELKGLNLVVQPKERPEDVSIFDSMWGSMTSSLQLAEECLKSKEDDEEDIDVSDVSDGLETIAKTIDTVLSNLKVRFFDTVIRIEHVSECKSSGVALEIRVTNAEYFDEAGVNLPSSTNSSQTAESDSIEPQAYSNKKVLFEGVGLYTAEISSESRVFSNSKELTPDALDSTQFVPGSPEMPPTHSTLPIQRCSDQQVHCEPILISKLNGQQELRLKLKLDEKVNGPKVDVEFNFGALNLFLSPQQVHMMLQLVHGLMKPSSDNDSTKNMPLSITNKPMRPADFLLVEQELQRQQEKHCPPTRSLKNHQGWSSHSLDESDEEFHLMVMENKSALESQPTVAAQDMESSFSSINSDTRSDYCTNPGPGFNRRASKSKANVQAMLTDPLTELTHFRGCCSSICIVILHDDSVHESINGRSFGGGSTFQSSVSLKERAEKYFEDLLAMQMSGFDFKNFPAARDPISELCQTNHLRLMATSLALDGNEKSSSSQCVLNFTLALYNLEILECLFNSPNDFSSSQTPTYIEILSFKNAETHVRPISDLRKPCLKMKYQQIECISQQRIFKPPANKLDFHLEPVVFEVDISLTDRIRTLLNPKTFIGKNCSKVEDFNWREEGVSSMNKMSQKTEVNFSSPLLVVNLRFPIPDLRSVHDRERVPWWQQNLHKEILVMELSVVTLATVIDNEVSQSKYEIQCRDFHGLFKESPAQRPVSFIRVSVDPDADKMSQDSGFDWPRLVICKTTNLSSVELEAGLTEHEEFTFSLSEALISNMETEPSPFCSSSVIYGSKLKNNHNDINTNELPPESDHDEVIKPAEKQHILNFMEQISTKSEFMCDFTLPTVNLVFPDRDLFELLYNRLVSDLLLWENTSLVPAASYDPSGFKVHAPGLDFSEQILKDAPFQTFSSFKSFANDSDSDDDDTVYCSVYEYCQRQRQKLKKPANSSTFTKLAISIGITKASVTIHTPVIDYSDNIVPDRCGKLQLRIEDGTLFIASSYRGDPNEGYFCLLSEKSSLYHNGSMSKPSEKSTVQPFSSLCQSGLPLVIYQSEAGVQLSSAATCDSNGNTQDMLTISVHIISNPKQQIKTFKVAVGICGATLRHYMYSVPEIWINQFIDFLKVKDYPVNGYTPLAVITELHINLKNCTIDYRPINLPLRTLLTAENLNLSCNVSATTPSFLFRIISEEMRLFISSNTTARRIELRKNYVCVIDTGLIDVSFRTNAEEKDVPKFELCATNNIIHIRTCADSFRALSDLLVYINMGGDLTSQLSSGDKKEVQINMEISGKKKTDADPDNLHHLMAEAMKESAPHQVQDMSSFDSEMPRYQSDSDPYNTDDEFCILEDDPGVGLMPKNGEPQVRLLTDEPIKIVENHFTVPPGKSDDLRAPKHFPNPLLRIALREMSLIWHLYGGNDFPSCKNKKKKSVRISSTDNSNRSSNETDATDSKNIAINTDSGVISFCKVTPLTKQFDINAVHYAMEHVSIDHSKVNSPLDSWISKGGMERNHEVLMELHMNKVRFQREIYSEDSEYASRYILLIHDIEIRDRLASSQINKFLYQYSSKSMPRQSHANMVEVKAVYTRPDLKLTCQECSLKVSCKPLRLNVDQDSLMFLIDFCQEVIEAVPPSEVSDADKDSHAQNLNTRQFPTSTNSAEAEGSGNQVNLRGNDESLGAEPETFYRFFSFSPDVLIRLDYQGKHVIMEQGAVQGLLMGLGQLNCSEIKLKRLCYRHGLLGHVKVFSYVANEWQQDIMKNQLPSLLGGVGPMHSFVQLFQGIRDLFFLPVEQYRKDGQIVRGLQRGASSFSTSTAMAFLDLTSRLVGAIQGAAEVAYDMVSPGPSVSNKFQRSIDSHRRCNQPADIREGVATAYNVVKEGLGDTARTIYRVASVEHEHKGVPGAVGGVLRQIPPAVVKPIIVGSEATHIMLGGVRHQLMPDAHQEDMDKWRTKTK